MRCIYCNTPLAAIDYCPGCGADVTLLKRIGRISNLLYNRGLEKAQVRDLSGAISCLQQSLKFNKENIDARNLLGLCYYETGEVVSALCEWVISKNMRDNNNPANEYINSLQTNKNQLDMINQSIRKYNQSIEYCRQNNEDMAIMQLRKVVSQNPKLVKAQQLLALLYMKHQEYEKARRILRKAAAVDNTNTTTLRYLTEIEEVTGRTSAFGSRRRRVRDEEHQEQQGTTLRYVSGTETIITPTTFRDSSTVATFINIGLGALLGGALIWFLAVPATRQSISEEANRKVTEANLELATGNAQLKDLQDQIDSYQSSVDNAKQDKEDAEAKMESYDELLGVANMYVSGEQTAAVDAISSIDGKKLAGNALTLYQSLKGAVSDTLFDQYYTSGTTAYASYDYQTAAEQLKLAVDADETGLNVNYYNALYYLAFAYYNLNDTANADKYFNEIIEKFPAHASEVQGYISSGKTAEGDGSSSQGEASMQSQDSGDSSSDNWSYGNDQTTYDESQVAWTDPTTGLHYDAYGNLLG